MITIYALSDPRTPKVYRYVGQTKDLVFRQMQHAGLKRKPQSTKELWVEMMRRDGILPQITPLELIDDDTQANAKERAWQESIPVMQLTNDRYSQCRRAAYRERRPARVGALNTARNAFDAEQITKALAECNGNITTAARKLGVSRPTVYERMQVLGIPKPKRVKNWLANKFSS